MIRFYEPSASSPRKDISKRNLHNMCKFWIYLHGLTIKKGYIISLKSDFELRWNKDSSYVVTCSKSEIQLGCIYTFIESYLVQIYLIQKSSSFSIHPFPKTLLTSLTWFSNLSCGQMLHLDFLELLLRKGMFLCSRRSASNSTGCITQQGENPNCWHNDVIKLSDFMERSIFQFPLHKWKAYMHSVKKHIMPKYVNYVSYSSLELMKNIFHKHTLHYICWRKK